MILCERIAGNYGHKTFQEKSLLFRPIMIINNRLEFQPRKNVIKCCHCEIPAKKATLRLQYPGKVYFLVVFSPCLKATTP